jgi:hypothetical protein
MPSESISDVAVPLRTVDPADPDSSDLAVLRRVVGDARVVCLGESAHFVSEFYRLRDRVLRFLVRELGFSAFVLESGLPEGLAVDEWVRGGPGNLTEVARTGITYAFGRCEEMRASWSGCAPGTLPADTRWASTAWTSPAGAPIPAPGSPCACGVYHPSAGTANC